MDLEQVGEALSFEIAFFMQGLDQSDMPLDEKGNLTQTLIFKTQALAIMVLLVSGHTDGFLHNLLRSARLRKKFLQDLHKNNIFDAYHQCSGRIRGLIGALVARDFNLAKEMIALTPGQFKEEMEYEDDYCYAQLLHHLIVNHLSQDDLEKFVDRSEQSAGSKKARIDVVKAIVNANDDEFDEAFLNLLETHEAMIEQERLRGQLEEPEIVAHREIFLEGLALLVLAEKAGIKTSSEYLYCPANALLPMDSHFPGE